MFSKSILFAQVTILLTIACFGNTASAERFFSPGPHHAEPETNFDKLDAPAPYRFESIVSAEVGLLGLQRSGVDTFDLVATDGTVGPAAVVATSDDLDPKMVTGSRYSLGFMNLLERWQGIDCDFVYFTIDDTIASATYDANNYATTNLEPSFYGGIPASPVTGNVVFLKSNLDSAEWVVGYRPFQRLRLTAGVRWFRFKEQFDILERDAFTSGSLVGFFSDSRNEAVGFQAGVESVLWTNGTARLYGKAKYADVNNKVSGDADTLSLDFAYQGDIDTSLVDVELGLSLPVAEWAAIQIAYQGLFLADGVGALDQSNTQSLFDPASQVPTFDKISWQGLHVGLSMMW